MFVSHAPLSSIEMMVTFGMSRDDVEKVIYDGKSFLKFCPDWKNAVLWEEWRQFGIQCFSEGPFPVFCFKYHLLTDSSEVHPSPPVPDRLKTINKKIPITKDNSGCPALPSITPSDNYKTKVVQSMLREYCAAHIRE